MSEVTKNAILSLIRTLLAVGAGIAVSRGYVSNDVAMQIMGTAVAFIPVVWGMVDKYLAEQKVEKRVVAAMSEPRAAWTDAQRAQFELLKSTTGAG
tara:strand:+ start:385 stop:672 length:288 start_codon:yes stop_codon:yes gene_type:complete